MKIENQGLFILILSVFVGSLTISSILACKIISLFGFFVPAGVIAYSITFLATDTISECWGKKKANQVVLGGFISLLFVFILIRIGIFLESAPFWKHDEAFNLILSSSSRIIIASFIAYLLSQLNDVWLFHFLKNKTNGKHLWLRNNLSTIISQFFDSFIFVTIAFYGVMPVWHMVFAQWMVKICIAFIDTPLVYLLVNKIGKEESNDMSGIKGKTI